MPGKATEGGDHTAQELTLARVALIGVGVAYLIVQLVHCSSNRAPGWDESVYLSQVTPGTKAVFFMASRARGITLLVAPITWLGGSIVAVRVFLAIASAISLIAAFQIWIPLVGVAAPIAAVVFSFSWMSLVAGSEVMPNLWAAILGVATVGLIARRLEGGARRNVVIASCLLGVMALFRPTEAAVVACAVGAYVVLFRRPSWRVLIWLGLGLLLGCLPWVVEMSIRFGGPVTALREAGKGHFAAAGLARNVRLNLVFTSYEKFRRAPVPVAGVVWWAVLVAMGIIAVWRGRTPRDRAVALLSCFGAVAIATEYLVLVSATAPRFLLPAYAFASLPVGIGIVALLRGRMAARAAGILVLMLVIPWAIWQGGVADRVQVKPTKSYAGLREAGLTVRRLAGGRSCSFMSPWGLPEIQLASGCDGSIPRQLGSGPSAAELRRLLRTRNEVFVVLGKRALPGSPLGSLTPVRSAGPYRRWFVYRVPG